jgi:hypothetical protein
MKMWGQQELKQMEAADDLHISPLRDDGTTYGTPTWIWSVVTAGELYVRPYHGRNSSWYKAAAMTQRAGQIRVTGMTKEVTFNDASGLPQESINAADRVKYSGSPYLNSMINTGTRATTVVIRPV